VPFLILALFLAALSGCDSYFFYPQRIHVANPYLERVLHEDVFFKTPDGVRLHGWFFHPNTEPRGTVLFFHGNAENISTHAGAVLWLAREGYQVFLFDYRGYGKSEGKPDMEGIHVDALAAIDEIFRMERVDKDRVAVFGQSLGGSVAVYAVANSPHRDRIRALVIDSAFSGYRRIAREKIAGVVLLWPLQYPLSLLVTDRYSASRWIGRVRPVSVLLLHGERTRSSRYGTGNGSTGSPGNRSSCGSPPERHTSGRFPMRIYGNGSFRSLPPSSGRGKTGKRDRGNGRRRGDRSAKVSSFSETFPRPDHLNYHE